MKPPIIINENGDVSFYRSVDIASRALEPIDVRNEEYTAYDSEGELVRLVATDPTVTILPSENGNVGPGELKEVLRDFFGRVGIDKNWICCASLSELVKKGIEEYESS